MPPSPPGHPLLGHLPETHRDPLGFVLRVAREYGPVTRIRFITRTFYLVTHPDGVRRVLLENHQNYDKRLAELAFARRVLGNGLLTNDGRSWLRQRRLIQPLFHHQRVAAFGALMVAEAEQVQARWEYLAKEARPVDLLREMMALTLAIVTKALFGGGPGGDLATIGAAISSLIEDLTFRTEVPLYPPPPFPTARNRRFVQAIRTLDQAVYAIIRERRRAARDTGDLLDLLLTARDDETDTMVNEKQIRDEVITFYLAGHETTAVALAWTWYLLSTDPDVERRLHAELDQTLGGRSPTVADLPRLTYTAMVLAEALRLYPPVWVTSRRAIAADQVCGYGIPAGAMVSAAIYAAHHDPTFWTDPERFNPDRFSSGTIDDRHAFAYAPFGAGPRQCIGRGFALTEATLILATLAQHFILRLPPDHIVQPKALATLRPGHRLPAILERRRLVG